MLEELEATRESSPVKANEFVPARKRLPFNKRNFLATTRKEVVPSTSDLEPTTTREFLPATSDWFNTNIYQPTSLVTSVLSIMHSVQTCLEPQQESVQPEETKKSSTNHVYFSSSVQGMNYYYKGA